MLHAIALTRLPGIGITLPAQLLLGGVDAEALLTRQELPEGLSPQGEKRLLAALAERQSALERAKMELEFCERQGIRVLRITDEDYPARLRETADPPAVLYYQGNANLNAPHLLSVVGTRRITEQGKRICSTLCSDIAEDFPDAVIVSGLAYGVDIHSHRAALRCGLQTVAVLAHGLDRVYPATHRATADEMTRHGGLLTEFPSGAIPDKGNFIRRNRIIAGLSMGTVIVESAIKGGALVTAEIANGHSRDVFAFPGRADDEFSAGCNHLIKTNGAALVTCAADITSALKWQPAEKKPRAIEQELFLTLSPDESALCALLRDSDGKSAAALALESGYAFSQVMALLFDLEMKGIVKSVAGSSYRLLR